MSLNINNSSSSSLTDALFGSSTIIQTSKKQETLPLEKATNEKIKPAIQTVIKDPATFKTSAIFEAIDHQSLSLVSKSLPPEIVPPTQSVQPVQSASQQQLPTLFVKNVFQTLPALSAADKERKANQERKESLIEELNLLVSQIKSTPSYPADHINKQLSQIVYFLQHHFYDRDTLANVKKSLDDINGETTILFAWKDVPQSSWQFLPLKQLLDPIKLTVNRDLRNEGG